MADGKEQNSHLLFLMVYLLMQYMYHGRSGYEPPFKRLFLGEKGRNLVNNESSIAHLSKE